METKTQILGLSIVVLLWLTPSYAGPWPGPTPHPKPVKPRIVRCRLREYPHCFFVWQPCPTECPTNCFMDCAACKPLCSCNIPGAVCQDPRFVGGDGITFYFHGQKDGDFCLLSDNNLHVNAHFIGKRNPNMKRDFTWVQSIGILFDCHRLSVGAKKTTTWDDANDRLTLSFDGKPIALPLSEGAKWQSTEAPHVSISRTRHTNGVTVEASGNFKITAMVVPITEKESKVHRYNITRDDCFAHLELGFKFYKLTDQVHGVLGQTYRKNYVSRAKLGVPVPLLGGDHEFSSSHLFATDCAVSRFHGELSSGGAEYASLLCNSGTNGRGVVCK